MDKTDKDFQAQERDGAQDGQEEGNHHQEHLAGKDVAEETECKRNNLGQLGDEFQNTDEKLDRAFKVKELGQVIKL